MFDNDSYNNAADPLVLAATASTFPETAAPGELRDDVRRILEVTTPLPLALRTREVDLGLDPDELGLAQAYAPKGKSAQANQLIQGAQAEIQYWSSPQRGVPGSPTGVEPTRGLPYAIDTDAAVAATRDPKNAQAMRADYTWKQAKWDSLGAAASDRWDEWAHRKDKQLTKSEAEAYYKARGLEVKESRDHISLYEAQKKADILISRQETETNYNAFWQTGNITFLQKADIFSKAALGSMVGTPLDLATTTASIFLPQWIVGGLAKAGEAAAGTFRTGEILRAASKVRTASNTAKIAAGTSTIASSSEPIGLLFLNSGKGLKSTLDIDARMVKIAGTVEKMRALNYEGLSALEKTGLDVLTWTAVDIPQVAYKKSAADRYGIMNYSGKDAMSEILMSGALGAVVPGALRFAGKRLGISPFELTERHINDLEIKTKTDVALGNMTPEAGERTLKEITKIKESLTQYRQGFKGPNPKIIQAVDELQRSNLTSDEVAYRLQSFIASINAGIVPKVTDLPFGKQMLSHIDARLLENLLDTTKSVEDVFGTSLAKTTTKQGLYGIQLSGDTGMLGARSLKGLTAQEASEQLGNLYRGLMLEDADGASLKTFTDWVNRFQNFYGDLNSILAEYKARFEVNKVDVKYSADQLINLKEELRDVYMKYKMSPEDYINHKRTTSEIRQGEALGEEMDRLRTPDYEALEKEATDFANEWVVEKKTKNGKVLYDFKDRSGKDDKGARFTAFLNELRQAAEDNKYLAETNDRYALMEESRIKNNIDKIEKFEVSDDTDFAYLFGTPRKNFADIEKIDQDEAAWNTMLNTKRIDRDSAMQDESYRKTSQLLEQYGTEESSTSSVYRVQKRRYDIIEQSKQEKYATLKDKILETLRGDQSFTKYATSFMQGKSANNYLKIKLKETLAQALDSMEISTYLPGRVKSDSVNRVIDAYMKEAKKNPQILEAFMGYEDIIKKYPHLARKTKFNVPEAEKAVQNIQESFQKSTKEIDTEAQKVLQEAPEDMEQSLQDLKKRRQDVQSLGEQVTDAERVNIEENKARIKGEAEDIARIQTYMNNFFQPIEKSLNIEFSRLQVQALHDMDIANTKLSLMMQHPELASEILIGDSTQTWYLFQGSKRNLEYIKRSAPSYVKDVQNTLYRMDKEKGWSLLTYFQTPENREEITRALISLKHDTRRAQEVSESMNKLTKGSEPQNSDAERVASVILDSITTLQSDMSKYGSAFNAELDVIDPKKMKYIDTLMSENVVNSLYQAMNTSLKLNPNRVTAGFMAGADTVRFGDKVLTKEKGLAKTKAMLAEIQNELSAFYNIENPMHRDLGLYVLSRMDLDNLYNSEKVRIGLNQVRDAILSGDLQSLIGDDLYNLNSIRSDIKLLRRKIIGDEGATVSTTSEVYKFITGFDDLGAVVDGSRSAYLDKYSRRYKFKDAESEMEAMHTLGYDTLEEALTHNFDTALKAQYSLELFGTSPIAMSKDLMLTYKNIYNSNKEFKDKLRTLSTINGVNVNKYNLNKADEAAVEYAIKSATGLNQQAPNSVTRWVNVLKSFFATPLLAAAGWKSFSDYGTIMENLVANGLVQGHMEAAATMSRAVKYMALNPKEFRRICISSTIEADKFLKYAMDDPGYNVLTQSKNMTLLDRVEAQQRKMAEFFLGKIAHMTPLTDINKSAAAWSIQDALGTIRNKSYDELTKTMGYSLERENIDAIDWDIYRNYSMTDFNKDCGIKGQGSYWVFDPFKVHEIPDEVAASALKAKGKQVNATSIHSYKNELLNKAFVMIDTSADEMISMPSQRITGFLRGKQVQGSMSAAIVEAGTQFQSFGCALLFNTYGRHIVNAVRGQTGITAIDMFNPFNKVDHMAKIQMGKNIMGAAFSVGVNMLLVDSTVEALRGKIYEPIKEDGSPNVEWMVSRLAAPLGPIGSALDTVFSGLDGSGQKGGGITLQVAPSASAIIRAGYRIGKPIASSKVQDKGTAVGAAILNEAARQTGVKTLPYTAVLFQMGIGSYLDELQAGGQANWSQMMKAREDRGQVVMPWEIAPQPLNFDISQ